MKSMIKRQGILKGTMILAIAVFLSKLIGVIYRIPLTNILGDDGSAIYAIAFQVYVLLIAVSAIGIPSAISKLVSECVALGSYQDAQRIYKLALMYTGVLSCILGIGLWFSADLIALNIYNRPELALPLRVLAPTVLIVSVMAVIRGYFQGLNTMTPTAISQVIEQLFNAIFSVILAYIYLNKGVQLAVVGSTMGTAIGALAGLLTLVFIHYSMYQNMKRNLIKSTTKVYGNNRQIIKCILITLIPIVISASIFSVMALIDSYMLVNKLPTSIEYLKQTNQLKLIPVTDAVIKDTKFIVDSLSGQYLNKYMSLLNVPVSLILLIATSAIPTISASMAKEDYGDVKRKINSIFKMGILFAAPAAIGLTVFSKPIMKLLYPRAPDGGSLLMCGSIVILFITISQLATGVLQGMGKQNIPTINAFIACVIKVILNIVLLSIPQLHIYSLIYSTTICYFVFSILNIRYLKTIIQIKLNWKELLLKPLLCSIVMGGISYSLYIALEFIIKNSNIALVIAILMAVIIYIIMGLLTKIIDKNDISKFL